MNHYVMLLFTIDIYSLIKFIYLTNIHINIIEVTLLILYIISVNLFIHQHLLTNKLT